MLYLLSLQLWHRILLGSYWKKHARNVSDEHWVAFDTVSVDSMSFVSESLKPSLARSHLTEYLLAPFALLTAPSPRASLIHKGDLGAESQHPTKL